MALNLDRMIGECVVVDTDSSLVYIGLLKQVSAETVLLEDADVHDRSEGTSSNEVYILNARKHGIKPNRKSVSIVLRRVVSISRLQDVVVY